MRLLLHEQRFDSILFTSCPPHNGSRNIDTLLVRQVDGEGTGLADTQRQVPGDTPSVQREIPEGARAPQTGPRGKSQDSTQGSDGRGESKRA